MITENYKLKIKNTAFSVQRSAFKNLFPVRCFLRAVRCDGFSLTEVLLAVATLTIGMAFVSGTFVAGVFLSTISSERTMAAVVADEAFAKIRLFGINPADSNLPADHLLHGAAPR